MLLQVRGSFKAMRGPVDFRLCSEILEYRRVYMWRRKRFTGNLTRLSSYRAKRKRRTHGDLRSTNFFAAVMTSYVKRRDRSNDRLLARYTQKYAKDHKLAHRLLKMAHAKTSLMCRRMARTNKLRFWRTGMFMFWSEVKAVFDLKTPPWTHSDEVMVKMKAGLAEMKKHQTTTCRGWQQEEIRTLLERAMNLLFWT